MSEVENLLQDWYDLKEKISRANRKLDSIKDRVKRIMKTNDETILESNYYQAKLKEGRREFISEKRIPKDVWERYKSVTKYEMLTISKRKKKKR